MNVSIFPSAEIANLMAAEQLISWLQHPATRNVMVAAGNTPLELYRLVAERRLSLGHLEFFALDEYVGVPEDEPRNCANLLRRAVAEAWAISSLNYHTISSDERRALAAIQEHERRIAAQGGLDVVVLGLGQNGHLGFNEPGSSRTATGRLIDLQSSSVEANRQWFNGKYAPTRGVTVGLPIIAAARQVMILAYGPHKASAVKAMLHGPVGEHCPASFLQEHPAAWAFLDRAAAGLDHPGDTK